MRVIITLDKKNGYSFFSKRISSDVEVSKDILKSLPDGEKLYMSSYSKSLFPDEYAERLIISSGPFPADATVFLEVLDVPEEADELVVYRWDKKYLSDKTYNPYEKFRKLVPDEFFEGHSHGKITKERYLR